MSSFEPLSYDRIDLLVETDPIALRDYASAVIREVDRARAELADAREQVRHVADDLDRAGDAIKQMAANHRTDIPALLEELDRLRSESRMLRTKATRLESDLAAAHATVAELDTANTQLAGEVQTLTEQLAATTLER